MQPSEETLLRRLQAAAYHATLVLHGPVREDVADELLAASRAVGDARRAAWERELHAEVKEAERRGKEDAERGLNAP